MSESSIERGRLPIDSLPPEQQVNVEQLENQTDELYGLRHQLVSFYRNYGQYLPTHTAGDKEKRMRLGDISKAVSEGQSLDELIPWDKVETNDENQNLPEIEKELTQAIQRDQIRAEFEVAIENYNDLKGKGGDWRARDLPASEREVRDYYRLRWGELGTAIQQFADIEHATKIIEAKLEYQRNQVQAKGARPAWLRVIDDYEKEYATQFQAAEGLVKNSPEAYLYALGRQLREAKELFDAQGRIVETPYVKTKMAHIQEILAQGRPVFIHGELGSGKTELAKHLARKELSKSHLARWEQDHPAPKEKADRPAWQAQRAEQAEALLISGHRGIEVDQIIASRGIERGQAPVPEEQVERIRRGWAEYRQCVLDAAKNQGQPAESLEALSTKLEHTDRELYEKAMLESWRNPVVTKTVLGPALQAKKEGRPLIIDEMNAIPHHTLIALNDILMRRPGETIVPPFPEAEPFIVQAGESVIATGNYKPEDGLMYVGRQPFDAAFLSRYGIVAYDYLPMQPTLEAPGLSAAEQREFRATNELYHMIVTRLLDKDLSVTLPADGFDKLKKLAYVSRHLEDIFSGRAADAGWYAEAREARVKPQDVLKENVLSIRHLLPIMDRWQADGFRRDLDDYLFLDYVARSDARPEEKTYLYQMLKIQGDFFPDAKGWPKTNEKDKILAYPIDQHMYGAEQSVGRRQPLADRPAALKTYSPKQVIEELFGPAPARTTIPREFVEGRGAKGAQEDTAEQLEQERLIDLLRATYEDLKKAGFDPLEGS